jgi:hypothetical protein
MRRVIFSALLGVTTLPLLAVSPEQILGSEQTKEAVSSEALPKSAYSEPAPEINLKTAKRERAIAISFKGGPSFRNYRLSSSTLNANLPAAVGYQLGLMVEKELNESRSLGFEFDYFSHLFSNTTGFTPSSFRITSWNTSADYSLLISGDTLAPNHESWWLSLGYQMNKRGGATTTPIVGITDLWFHGPRAGFKYSGPHLFGDLGLNFSSHLMIPWFFQENLQTTGFFKFGLSSTTALDLRYELRDTATLTAGIRLHVDYRNYFGTGTRGAADAQEFEWVLTIPVTFQIRF